MKKCPYCAEEIQEEAIVCRYCQRDLTKQPKKRRIPLWLSIILGLLTLTFMKACYDATGITYYLDRSMYLRSHPNLQTSTPIKVVPANVNMIPTLIQVFATVQWNPTMVFEEPDKNSAIIDKFHNGDRVRIRYRTSDSIWVKIDQGWVLTQDLNLDSGIEILPTKIP